MEKPTSGIAVDGSCTGGNPGDAAYRIVDIETGNILFESKIGFGTNNIAEYVGLCRAIFEFPTAKIYTDSLTAMAWVRKKKNKSTLEHPYLDRCDKMINNLKVPPNVEHWKTKEWGEIPADFGNKKKKSKSKKDE